MTEHRSNFLSHLDAVNFPASKQDLVAEAEADGAPQELIEALQALGSERFPDRGAVEQALSANR